MPTGRTKKGKAKKSTDPRYKVFDKMSSRISNKEKANMKNPFPVKSRAHRRLEQQKKRFKGF